MTTLVPIAKWRNQQIIHLVNIGRGSSLAFIKFSIEKAVMEILFREMMLTSVSGWIALWIDPKIYLEMFVIGIGTYAAVSLLEYRRIRKIPMDEALKNVE